MSLWDALFHRQPGSEDRKPLSKDERERYEEAKDETDRMRRSMEFIEREASLHGPFRRRRDD